jgi:hypothetical protein
VVTLAIAGCMDHAERAALRGSTETAILLFPIVRIDRTGPSGEALDVEFP